MRVHLTMESANKKTGPIPVSTSERSSCPSSCAWYDKGCYAKYGPLGMHWRKVGERGMSWGDFCKKIAKLTTGILWRHNQAGDLPGKDKTIALSMLRKLVDANKGKRGFTYTHKPVLGTGKVQRDNRKAIRESNKKGFVINLSADNIEEADRMMMLGIAPVTVVLDSAAESEANRRTPNGHTIVVCPAARTDVDTNCQECQLCAVPNRKSIIGFPAHGTARVNVSQRASLAIVE